ncbi:Cyclin-dependent kinase 1 [Taenia solium]|eukprot:TsM_001078700 transcript=TsM_001078700 gene=TsM_001078700
MEEAVKAARLVHKCLDRKPGRLEALKQIKLKHSDQSVPSTALREIALLKELKHPNIATQLQKIYHFFGLEHVILVEGQLYLVFVYLNADLRWYLDLNYKNTGLSSGPV